MNNFTPGTVFSHLQTSKVFQPDDVARMHKMLHLLCDQEKVAATSPRYSEIAKGIVSVYKPELTDQEVLFHAKNW